MIANRFNPLGKAFSKTADAYIQDGLILHWDGIENVGYGTHDSASTVWRDLVGGVELTLNGGATWSKNALVLDSTGFAQNLEATGYTDSLYSLEVVIRCTGNNYYRQIVANIGTRFMFGFFDSSLFYVGRNTLKYRRFPITQELHEGTNTFGKALSPYAAFLNGETRIGNDGDWWTPSVDGITLGASNAGNYGKFIGEIMAVRGYNRNLTEEEFKFNADIDKERF